jgi:hypothetical protein
MYTFKGKIVDDLTDEERFDLITDGRLREPIYDFGTELVADDDILYECEYLSEEKTLKNSRILWCRTRKPDEFTILPEDPALEEFDDSYRDEHYLEIKARVAKGDYPDLSELKSPEEMKLVLPKLLEDGIVKFNKDTGEYSLNKDVQAEVNKRTMDGTIDTEDLKAGEPN